MPRTRFARSVSCLVFFLAPWSSALAQGQPRVDQAAIDQAVTAGVEFLRQTQAKDGTWVFQPGNQEFNLGATSLVGVTLLECGLDKSDPVLATIARMIRTKGPRLTKTYAIASAVMFLDRYDGGPKDADLIRQLAFRLAAGQDRKTGGWSYDCRALNATAQSQVLSFLQRNRGPFQFGNQRPDTSHVRGVGADNSNTQFAILALWIARRRNLPVDHPLMLAEWRFRMTQLRDGGWGYGRDGSTDLAGTTAMTCTGMLALGIGSGMQKERQSTRKPSGDAGEPKEGGAQAPGDIRIDPAVAAAKTFLASKIAKKEALGSQRLYFLWSLERVAVAFGFEDLDGLDWYAWGSQLLLKAQKMDGSWEADNGPVVDTCFALLFLRKANLIKDLSEGISQLRIDEKANTKPPMPE